MKKIKSILCVALLSVFLSGNVLAADTGGTGFFSFFSQIYSAVASLAGRDDNCTPRLCTGCKPGQIDENGNCRPI